MPHDPTGTAMLANRQRPASEPTSRYQGNESNVFLPQNPRQAMSIPPRCDVDQGKCPLSCNSRAVHI